MKVCGTKGDLVVSGSRGAEWLRDVGGGWRAGSCSGIYGGSGDSSRGCEYFGEDEAERFEVSSE